MIEQILLPIVSWLRSDFTVNRAFLIYEDILAKNLVFIFRKGENDVSDEILYLVSEESKFVTGSELVIDGGYTCK